MSDLRIKLSLIAGGLLVVIFGFPALSALAADGDDYGVSADYYLNQQRFGGTEMRAVSDDYEITGMLGEPANGLSSSADFVFDNGTVWRTPGTLFLAIVDDAYSVVDSPSVGMDAVTFSNSPQGSSGTLGTDTERIYWENFDAADTAGFSITIAATDSPAAVWEGAAPVYYDFNDGDDTTDGADADAYGGQLIVDPSGGGVTARPGYGSTTGISVGSSAAFEEGVTDSIPLVTASADSDDYHAAYVTDVSLVQLIPASQPADTYTIGMMLTIA
jgi:hypothetical protein